MADTPRPADKTRGATSAPRHRFAQRHSEALDDGWGTLEALYEDAQPLQTVVREISARSIISRNTSPDIGFEQSVNPYLGCEHGCIYCFARPSHAYWDHNPGLDFETQLYAKAQAPELLRAAFNAAGYEPKPIALGINTDGWQPIEARLRISRALLEVMVEYRHPVLIVTKSRLLERDIDLLADLARDGLVGVMISLTSLDPQIKRTLEPRAAGPQSRLALIRALRAAGVPVGVLLAPVIPAITDHEIEALLEAAAEAGAERASWVLLRLPHEVAPLFRDWLQAHYPQRAAHVMSLVQQMRGGRDYDASFHQRQRGTGVFAQLYQQRFDKACRRLGLAQKRHSHFGLNTGAFRAPGQQHSLF